jgi:hypothetical protein
LYGGLEINEKIVKQIEREIGAERMKTRRAKRINKTKNAYL